MTEFRICPQCQLIRARADMRGDGRCIYCPKQPRLLAPPAPLPVTRYPERPGDAVEAIVRRLEAQG